jgi:hypothetical protein
VSALTGVGVLVGYLAGRSIIRANAAARFEKDLQVYAALAPAPPPEGVEQRRPPPARGITGKVRGKMVVINVNERKVDDLYFALPDDLRASNPAEVATVVLLTADFREAQWPHAGEPREPIFFVISWLWAFPV